MGELLCRSFYCLVKDRESAVPVHEHGVTRAAHIRKREQRHRLVGVRTFCVTWVGTLVVLCRSDVLYTPRAELAWADEREQIREEKTRSDFFRREWIGGGGGLWANRVMKSESLGHGA